MSHLWAVNALLLGEELAGRNNCGRGAGQGRRKGWSASLCEVVMQIY
jgi:hypothetical protein